MCHLLEDFYLHYTTPLLWVKVQYCRNHKHQAKNSCRNAKNPGHPEALAGNQKMCTKFHYDDIIVIGCTNEHFPSIVLQGEPNVLGIT